MLSLLLRGTEAAGIWVRFGSDYMVQGEVDRHTEPAVVDAALAAFRDHAGAGYRVRGSTRRGRARVIVVLEWPSSLLVRAQDSAHAELSSPPARLPDGGSAIAVVLGELDTGLTVDRANVLPLSAGRFCDALDAAARGADMPIPGAPPSAAAHPEPAAPVPAPAPDAEAHDPWGGPVLSATLPDEDADAIEETAAVGGVSDGFGVSEELQPPPSRPDLEAFSTAPGAAAPRRGAARLPWDAWLDAVADVPTDPRGGLEDAVVPALLALSPDDDAPPGRSIGGWLTPDGVRAPWGPPHPLGDRSRVPTDVMRVLSGVSGSAALVVFGLAMAALISGLVQPHDAQVRAQPKPFNIPTISFCSDSNPAFEEAMHCWTERILNGREDFENSRCETRPEDAADTRAGFCGLAHREDAAGLRGAGADRVLAEACFQVLGEPEQYAEPSTGRRARPRARVAAFLTDDRLRIQELEEVRQRLIDDCDLCESAARERIRDRSVLTWVSPELRGGMPVSSPLAAALDRCPKGDALWVGDDLSGRFPFGTYARSRFPDGIEGTPPEWACFDYSLSSRHRNILRPPDGLAEDVRLVTPRDLEPGALPQDPLGAFGIKSQLGLHALLSGELAPGGDAEPGAIACASLVREELNSYRSVHPLAGVEEPGMRGLCGQVCAAYFHLIDAPPAWETRDADLALCVTGRVDPRAPERLCHDRTLPIPRTSFEETILSNSDDLKKSRWLSHGRLDARWSPGTAKDWLGQAHGSWAMDTSDAALGEDCGIVEEHDDNGEWGGAFFASDRPTEDRYEFEEDRAPRGSAATIGALPDPILACGAQIVAQEDLGEAGLPALLPTGSVAGDYLQNVQLVAEELADESLAVQRSRRTCEDLASLCFTSAALMVNRADLLWDYAPALASPSTAENLAVAMGPLLDRRYRERCADDRAGGGRRDRCAGPWRVEEDAPICEALCKAGARNYSLPARHAVPEARLDAAFELASATPVCSGLRDLWNERADADLNFESACLAGVRTHRALAVGLLRGDR